MALLTAQQQVVLGKKNKKNQMMRLQRRLDYSARPTHMLQMEHRSICRGNAEAWCVHWRGTFRSEWEKQWRCEDAHVLSVLPGVCGCPTLWPHLLRKSSLVRSNAYIQLTHRSTDRPLCRRASFHGARFLSRHSLTHTYTQTCSHRTPLLSSHPFSHPLSPICPRS